MASLRRGYRQAGKSWAWPQQGGERGELSLLLLAQPMEQLSSGRRELGSKPGNGWKVALGATEVLFAPLLAWNDSSAGG